MSPEGEASGGDEVPVDLAKAFDLGPIDQVAFVVRDMETALPAYRALFGEFDVNIVALTPEDIEYRGAPANATIAVALGASGPIQIELIQLVAGDAPFGEHLRRHGEGLHHVRFPVADMAGKMAELVAAGFTPVLEGHRSNGTSFVYLEAPEAFGYTLFELIQFGQP
jgi:catechol 2,3-dioxygenase-like lactoylglutathione lyase family enzyme